MKPNLEIEALAERIMSDAGISLPLRLPGGKYIRWVMRVPNLESRCRIQRMYLKMGVTHEELKAYTFEQKQEFMLKAAQSIKAINNTTTLVDMVNTLLQFENWLVSHREEYPEIDDKLIILINQLHSDFMGIKFKRK